MGISILRYRAEDLDLWRASQILGLLAGHLGFALDVTLSLQNINPVFTFLKS